MRSDFNLPEAIVRSRMMVLFLLIKGRVYMYREGYIQEIPGCRCVNAFGLALHISDLASG